MILKKILFMIPTLDHGGAEKVLVNLVNNMNKEKFDITVLTLFGGGVNRQFLKPHIKEGFCIKKIFPGNSKLLKLFSPNTLYKKYIKEYYDIIVSYLEGPTARIVSGCTDSDTKLVSWIHVQQENMKIASAAFRNINEAKKCYNKFDNTVCVSEYVKNNFIENFDFKKPIEVLYNTNETDEIIKLSDEEVTDYDFTDNVNTLVALGTLKKSKGFDKLARIHRRLLDEGIRNRVIILGTGPEKDNLDTLISELDIKDTFTLLGYNTNPYKYLKNSDLFVCASVAEGFSTAATESLIVGTPVCTVDVSGMKEMLGYDNEFGIVTENNEEALYEGIKNMLISDKLLEQYAEKALERGRFFDKKNTTKAVEEMLENL